MAACLLKLTVLACLGGDVPAGELPASVYALLKIVRLGRTGVCFCRMIGSEHSVFGTYAVSAYSILVCC